VQGLEGGDEVETMLIMTRNGGEAVRASNSPSDSKAGSRRGMT
jgi:hypothetical protein